MEAIERFLGDGYGDGSGYRYSDGSGSGYGSGYGDGDGDGSGYGSGYGYGYGYGDGDGSGDGFGDGSGYGYGSGSGDGDGPGYGYGDGDGSGVTSFKGQKVYYIDGVATLIDRVHSTYAQGHILNKDLTLTPCYIARVGNSFAHGESLPKAHADAQKKEMQNMPVEKRIERFIAEHPDKEKKYDAQDLFDWHGVLTGSCMMGRQQFCKEHGINVKNDSFTVKEFIKITKNAFGKEVIEELAKHYPR